MGSIEVKSIGTLIDELITTKLKLYLSNVSHTPFEVPDDSSILLLLAELTETNMAIFFALEDANEQAERGDHLEVGKSYGKAQALNSRRTALIAAIDERLGEGNITQTEKTF